ncbi:MAG: D-alanyl-D-alanine endopeptidase [Burkholderiales bacterium]|nr:D-alanyl-D-alanine endopeptidase [Burkholderiales bacterium]
MSAVLSLSAPVAEAAARTKAATKTSVVKSKGHRAKAAGAPRKGSHRGRAAHAASPVAANVPDLTPVEVNAPALVAGKVATAPSSNMAAASGASGASFGQLYGLHHTNDPLDLKSSAALVVDQDTNEVLFAKNSEAVLPIASLTKLMTATVIVEAKLPMDDMVSVTAEDVDTEKNSSSRLSVGTTLTRGELLHLALMSSENRAAHALGRTYPGGLSAFVVAMNTKAKSLGMTDTRYVDPTGLNSRNQSSAKDLATLVKSAYQQPLIRELSTSREYTARVGSRQVQFHNTNSLVRSPSWDIGLQKTGYIVEAGRCLVMQAKMAGRKFIMVFLDSSGKYSRQADAERVRRWIEVASKRNSAMSSLNNGKVTS